MLVIAALLSRLLSKPEYATYRQTILAFQVASPLLALGLPQALLYFLPREPGRERGILTEVLVVLVSVGLAMAVFMLVGGNEVVARLFKNPNLEETLTYFAPYAV
ncbi:MAG: hypothetical protein P8J87_07050, partial [Verrucomicrobiales bacterium]|nr:hypothetical protein [Verrucomicrobiales bacterium]